VEGREGSLRRRQSQEGRVLNAGQFSRAVHGRKFVNHATAGSHGQRFSDHGLLSRVAHTSRRFEGVKKSDWPFVAALYDRRLEFLHFPRGRGLCQSPIAEIEVQMFGQFGMLNHFLAQRVAQSLAVQRLWGS